MTLFDWFASRKIKPYTGSRLAPSRWIAPDSLQTWTCHVCGDERPDEFIAVKTFDLSQQFGLPPNHARENVRHCTDRPQCVAGAEGARRWATNDDA